MSSPRQPSPVVRRLAAVGICSLALVGLSATAASAHVTVRADSTTPGSFSQLTFRVPNESDSAGTVKLAIRLPQDTPFPFVSVKPVPGWKVAIEEAPLPTPVESEGGATITKAARTITWTADRGTQIRPGEYQEFSISAGPMPEVETLTIPAVQTYSDGEEAAWNEPIPESGEEPERPAPTIELAAAGTATGSASPSAPTSSPPAGPSTSTAPATVVDASDTTARWLAGAALVVGLAAGALGGLGLRRRSQP